MVAEVQLVVARGLLDSDGDAMVRHRVVHIRFSSHAHRTNAGSQQHEKQPHRYRLSSTLDNVSQLSVQGAIRQGAWLIRLLNGTSKLII